MADFKYSRGVRRNGPEKRYVNTYDDARLDEFVRVGRPPLIREPVQVLRAGEVVVLKASDRTDHTAVYVGRERIGTLTWRETLELLTEGLIRVGRVEYSLSHP